MEDAGVDNVKEMLPPFLSSWIRFGAQIPPCIPSC